MPSHSSSARSRRRATPATRMDVLFHVALPERKTAAVMASPRGLPGPERHGLSAVASRRGMRARR